MSFDIKKTELPSSPEEAKPILTALATRAWVTLEPIYKNIEDWWNIIDYPKRIFVLFEICMDKEKLGFILYEERVCEGTRHNWM